MRQSGSTALVTGASRGFGRAIASALHATGVEVVAVARNGELLASLRDELDDALTTVVADAADPVVAGNLIEQYRPDTLVLNAGAPPLMRPLQHQTWDTFSRNWDVDVRHAFHWIREALLLPLAPGSTVVTMSSGAAVAGSPLSGGYAGAKATIRFITSYAADESERAGLGIRFLSLLPRLTAATELGAMAVAAYAAPRQGRCRRVPGARRSRLEPRGRRQGDRRRGGLGGVRVRCVPADAGGADPRRMNAGRGYGAVVRAVTASEAIAAEELERYRRELTGYSYRMLGSIHEAEDAVQDTMMRAWRALETLEDRTGLRPWLYRIATNVCIDMLKRRSRRALPMDVAPVATSDARLGVRRPEANWIQPAPDSLILPPDDDPGELAVSRESVRLAFIAALQHLAPRQRAVLILRDVLRWRADEVAVLLETSADAVNSALRRARSALATVEAEPAPSQPAEADRELLAAYVDAFHRHDVDALVALLRDDAIVQMPPFELWLRGATTSGAG